MVVKKLKKILKSEEGQAVFELVVFLPFFIFFFTILVTIGNAINGSINQQKAVRRYTYYLIKGNSMIPAKDDLDRWAGEGNFTGAGTHFIGWREKSNGGEDTIATCYKMNSLFGTGVEETCEEPAGGSLSSHVRVFTAYGICGEFFDLQNGVWNSNPFRYGNQGCVRR